MDGQLPEPLLVLVASYYPKLGEAACKIGDQDLVKRILAIRYEFDISRMLGVACVSEHFELASYLWDFMGKSCDQSALFQVIHKKGSSVSFMWATKLLERDPWMDSSDTQDSLRSGNESLGWWLYLNGIQAPNDDTALYSAVDGNCINVVKELLHKVPCRLSLYTIEHAFRRACIDGSVQIMELLTDRKRQNPATFPRPQASVISKYDLFQRACYDGQLNVAQWLLEWQQECKIPSRKNILDVAFAGACEKGHLEVAKWVLSIRPTQWRKTSEWMRPALVAACMNGCTQVVAWLCEDPARMTVKDVRLDSARAFRAACFSGYLGVAQLLWGMGLTHEDLGDWRDVILWMVCEAGHVEMVEWLILTGFKISSNIGRSLVQDANCRIVHVLQSLVDNGASRTTLLEICSSMELTDELSSFLKTL